MSEKPTDPVPMNVDRPATGKPYHAPAVRLFGSLRVLTQGTRTSGNDTGAGKKN